MSRKRSSVWLHFEELQVGKLAKCLICKTNYSLTNNSVGNLRRHLQNKHPTVKLNQNQKETEVIKVDYSEDTVSEENPNVPSQSTSNAESQVTHMQGFGCNIPTNSQSKTSHFFRSKRPISLPLVRTLNDQLVRLLCKSYYPISMVENEEFKKFIAMLCPGYTLPSRKTITTSLMVQKYDECKTLLRGKLSNVEAVCLTMDGWTSVKNESFMAVTAHFINDSNQLDSALLTCQEFHQRHTAVNIANFLQEVVEEWEIDNKISLIVTDNAPNMVSAVKSKWKHLPCFAHTLNLVVQTALKEQGVATVIKKVKGDFFISKN